MHGCTCGIIGYGIVIAGHFDHRAFPALILGFFTLAVTIHAIYNILGSAYFGLAGICVDLVFPVFLFFALLLSTTSTLCPCSATARVPER